MMKSISRLVSIPLLLAMLLAIIPVPVHAEPAVLSVTPNSIINDVENVVQVSGREFDGTAQVLFDGTPISTDRSSIPDLLYATIPAGVSVGSHQITVTMNGTPISGF